MSDNLFNFFSKFVYLRIVENGRERKREAAMGRGGDDDCAANHCFHPRTPTKAAVAADGSEELEFTQLSPAEDRSLSVLPFSVDLSHEAEAGMKPRSTDVECKGCSRHPHVWGRHLSR